MQEPIEFAAVAPQLAARGWRPFPGYQETKVPAMRGWSGLNRAPWECTDLLAAIDEYQPPEAFCCCVAVQPEIVAIDLDITNPEHAAAAATLADQFLGITPLVRIGLAPKCVRVYRNGDGVTVHLIGAVHIADAEFYDGLNESFRHYDALLYEMVKPKEMPAPVRGQKSGSMVSAFQRFLTDVLKLEFQLDGIDYSAPNFVHADLDVETFYKLQEERGESLFTLMLQSMMSQMARAGQPGAPPPITIFDLLAAMNRPDSARQYKLLLARQFQDIEAQVAGLEGPNGSVLLTERNKAALRVLKETIEAGKKDIGVFYGAGHMHGLEEALVNDMGFERVGTEWRVAWDMTPSAQAAPATTPRPGTRAAPVGAR